MIWKMYRAFFIFVLLGFISVCGQYLQSPCPEYFEYRQDNSGVHGLIKLKPFGPVATLLVRANFTIGTRLPSTFAGSIQPIGSELTLLREFNQGAPIRYRIDFPVQSPLPKLVALIVNDNIICYGPGDTVGEARYVTTISLQHMLFFKSGTNGLYPIQNQPQTSRPEIIRVPQTQSNQPTQNFFNIINNDNKEDDWNLDGQSFYIVDNNRPVYQSPEYQKPDNYPEYPINPPEIIIDRPESTTRRVTTPSTTIRTTVRTTKRPLTTSPSPLPPPEPFNTGSIQTTECGINGYNDVNDPGIPLIFKGESYARGDWPWLVAIYKFEFTALSYICAGTLLSDRHVISAAHCMRNKRSRNTNIKNIRVMAGIHNLAEWTDDDITVTRSLSSVSIHESYNVSTIANDILIMTLSRTLPFDTNIRPACLWNGNTDLEEIVGRSGVVAGWGANEIGPSGKGEPRMVQMPVVSTEMCRSSKAEFHSLTSTRTLCAGDQNGAGPCLGDSGGGLYLLDKGRWRLRGIVSLSLKAEGVNICDLNQYVVFTDVAQYLPWVKKVMAESIR